MTGEIDGYIEKEVNGNKHLTFASTDKSKRVLEKYTNPVKADKSVKYEKDYMRIKFNSDDDLP